MELFYVYYLIDPRNDKVFYVGKGKKDRMFEHEKMVKRNDTANKNKKLYNKIRKVLSEKHQIIYKKVFESTDEKEVLLKEKEIINELGIHNLCNLRDGGNGGALYGEALESMKKSLTGKKASQATKDKMSKTRKGKKRNISEATRLIWKNNAINNPNFGMTGRTQSEETKKKIGNANRGKVKSEETRKKLSDSLKGYKHSEEAKLNMSKAQKGHSTSDETRKKISEAHKGRNKGKTYEEMYGKEKALEIRRKQSLTHIEKNKK